MRHLKLLFLFLLFYFFVPSLKAADDCMCDPARDRAVLVALYNSTSGDTWEINDNWLSEQPLNEWFGVSTNEEGCVTTIDLCWNYLSGTIPVTLSNLTELSYLNFLNNSLSGTIPVWLSNLQNLTYLNLSLNDFNGTIPPELGQLKNLTELYLYWNDLSGTIPVELTNLEKLRILNLSINELSGSIPAEIANLKNLGELMLFDNQLSGTIPAEISALQNLRELNFNVNNLSGAIPVELGQLTNLERLLLGSNQLSGSVPIELGQLTKLNELYLNNNQFSGCYSEVLRQFCTLGTTSSNNFSRGYDLKNNPQLPWQGDFQRFCNGEAQIGAPCDDGNPNTSNDRIGEDCNCGGNNTDLSPVIIGVESASSICAAAPITINFDQAIKCENINRVRVRLIAEDGREYVGTTFAEDCLRGESTISMLVINADFRGANGGNYQLIIENTEANRQAFVNENGESMLLPVELEVDLPPDNSANVEVAPTFATRNNNICAGEVIVLEASTFPPDFFNSNSYTWRFNGNIIGTGNTISVTQPGTYEVEMRRNGSTSSPACETGFVEYILESPDTPSITILETECSEDRTSYSAEVNTEAGNTLSILDGAGTIEGGGGFFRIRDIPEGYNITVRATNPSSGCIAEQVIQAPLCSCPAIAAPQSNGDAAICAGEPFPLLSVRANLDADREVRWYSTATGGVPIFTGLSFPPSSPGTYYAEVYDLDTGCPSPRTAVKITVFPNPIATIQGTSFVCPSSSTNLTASLQSGNAVSYEWTNGSFTPTISVVSGYYTVTITDVNGCQSEAGQSISEFPVESASISGDLSICEGEFTTLRASAGQAYQWSTGATGNSITVFQNGIYTVTVTDANGCESVASVAVTEAADCDCLTPSLTIPTTPSCAGDNRTYSVRVNTEAENTITASIGSIAGSGGFLTVYNIPVGQATTVTVTNPEGCNAVRTIQSPNCGDNDCSNNQATIGGPSQLCPGEQANITASLTSGSAASYQWSASANNAISPSVSVGAGSYRVTITDVNGCEWEASKTISEFPVQPASISGNTSVCAGEATILTASAGSSYAWSNFASSNSVSVGAGAYSVTITDANGCESVASVTVNEAPSPRVTVVDFGNCSDDRQSYLIRVNTDAENTLSVLGNLGTVTGGGGFLTVRDIPAGQNITIRITNPEGCEVTRTIAAPNCACPSIAPPISAGDVEICSDEAIPSLGVSANTGENLEIRWYDAPTGGTALATGLSFTPTQAGSYYAAVYNTVSNCTSQRVGIRLSIIDCDCPTPSLTIPTTPSCAGDNRTYSVRVNTEAENTLTSTAGIVAGSSGFLTVYNIPVGQAITITVTSPDGCTNSRTIQSPSCLGEECPDIAAPQGNGDVITCTSGRVGALSVNTSNLEPNEEIRWYDVPTGGTAIGIGAAIGTNRAGTYYAEIYNALTGCSSPRTAMRVNNYPVPNAIIQGDMQICPSETTQLIARLEEGNAATFEWNNFASSDRVAVSTGSYTVTITDTNGCTAEASITVSESPLPTLDFPASPVCSNDAQSYSIQVRTEATNSVSANAGTITGEAGIFSIADIPANMPITISVQNVEGCEITEVFAAPDCRPCSDIPVTISSTMPAISEDGYLELCIGETLIVQGTSANNAAINYTWDMGNGTRLEGENISYAYTQSGGYVVTLRASETNNCSNTNIAQLKVRVAPVPSATLAADASFCENTPIVLEAALSPLADNSTAKVELVQGTANCTVNNPFFETEVIPDAISGATPNIYQSTLEINSFEAGATFQLDDLEAVCINMEHSWARDLKISLICPTGESVILHNYWGQTGNRIELGEPTENDNELVIPGIGADYCWQNEVTNGTIISYVDAISPTTPVNLPSGNYQPYQDFNQFIGCPLNGRWTLEIIDHWSLDNGVVFDWGLSFGGNENSALSFSPAITSFQWDASSSMQVELPAQSAGMLDVPYTMTDDFGCMYQDTLAIEVEECNCPPSSLPTPQVISISCTNNSTTYSVRVNTAPDDILTTSAGLVAGSSGFLTVYNIPVGEAIMITVTNAAGCPLTQQIAAPNCDDQSECPTKAAPQSTGDKQICEGEAIPALSVTSAGVNSTSEIRWYLMEVGGTPIATGLSFTPVVAGTYYAEIYDTSNDCASPRRAITLSIIACIGDDVASAVQEDMNTFTVVRIQPNPFKGETAIVFQQTTDDWVEVMLYDVAGRMLHQARTYYAEGIHEWKIDEKLLGESGVYFYRIQNGTGQTMGKLILQK